MRGLRLKLTIHFEDLFSFLHPFKELGFGVADGEVIHGGAPGVDARLDQKLLVLRFPGSILGKNLAPEYALGNPGEVLACKLLMQGQDHIVATPVSIGPDEALAADFLQQGLQLHLQGYA